MENNSKQENEKFSSENEETNATEEQESQPEVQLTSNGNIQDSPEEIAAIEIPESDIRGGIPEQADEASETALHNAEEATTEKEIPEISAETEIPPADEPAEVSEPETGPSGEENQNTIITETAGEHPSETVSEQAKPASAEDDEDDDLQEEDHHDEDDHHDDTHDEDDDNFEGMSKEQLLKFVQDASEHSEGRNMNKKVQMARAEFNRIVREERNDALENWKSEGNDESTFEPPVEVLLTDFNQAFKGYKKSRQEYINNLNLQKDENLVLKKEILEKLKTLTEAEEVHSFNEFRKLQDEWRKIGHVPITEAENIWNSYNFYVNKFYELRSLYSEFRELDNKRNLTAKEEVVTKIESLDELEDLNEALKQMKQYQDEWKHIGPVPKDQLDAIITRYKNAVIRIYEKKEKLSEELQARREQNYEAKKALLEKIEEFSQFASARVQDWINKNQELGQWIENWRSIGAIPLSKGTELKDRFSAAVRQFNRNKNDFFRSRKREKVDNLKKKTGLCEKVEALLEEENPMQHKKEVIKIQDEWKKSGPVPLKYSDKLWKRFQAACDAFFAKIVANQSDKDKEQFDNLKKKNDIITRIEEMMKLEIIENPEKQIRTLQDEFNEIGYVPFREKDKIRKRFFTALNGLISKVGKEVGTKDELLGFKLSVQSWGQEGGGHLKLDNEERKLSKELKRLENEVSTLENNIEFFRNSTSKNAEELRANMDKQISELKEKISEMQEKISMIRKATRR